MALIRCYSIFHLFLLLVSSLSHSHKKPEFPNSSVLINFFSSRLCFAAMAAFTSNVDVKMDIKTSSSANVDRLKLLYPMVNEEETPLPRSWSPKDKFNYIGLSQNNLRVHYKGTYMKIPPSFYLLGAFLLKVFLRSFIETRSFCQGFLSGYHEFNFNTYVCFSLILNYLAISLQFSARKG